MRFLLLVILLSLNCTTLLSQQLLPFSVKGKFNSDTIGGTIYLLYEVNGAGHKDSCKIKNGVFSFSGNLIHPVYTILSFKGNRKEFFFRTQANDYFI